MGFFMPPNMSEVFYKESYEDFIEVKEPVELRSFCWTPRQSLYVGCAGGQLLSVDFDTGSTTVLVNPQPLMKVTKLKFLYCSGICLWQSAWDPTGCC